MKKVGLAVFIAFLLMCVGCSNSDENVSPTDNEVIGDLSGEAADSVDDSSDDKSSDSISEASDDEVSVSLADMLPDASAIFEEATFSVVSDGKKMYCFTVDGYKEGDYERYVEECKKNFTDVKFDIYTDSNNKFEAKTEDGKYYVSVQLIFEQESFTVTCGVSRT